ncbi:UDP-glucose--hexose-1-phosphate uridylyltransferase [Terrihalobacillus insolitus]|uniref:UDP-glucose--hexose-1-phosphate uridylyltransferase n=1 Tax=Terrihalobacillus insolitus TaxID=2950438 RepID=UPI00234087B9|nr:UDP-glucose--hexose-1-phosphate uridylyltransferase [Terrihalobacillus insolitus]MDC3414826.1 UDP-glucose--hexose-1-phosphate uridylyltransferase [Terrihalobacillus insolitus]
MTIYQKLSALIEQAVIVQLIGVEDKIYVRNQLLGLLQLDSYTEPDTFETNQSIPDLLEALITYAVQQGVIENVFDDKEILSAKIMNLFVARPSVIHDTFYDKYEDSPEAATDYLYQLSKNSNYIQMNRIQKNIQFQADTLYGTLDITINLSKPEKDPEQLKRERALKVNTGYPKCVLCVENEGYVGRTGHPARSNHRIVRIPLNNENWYLQYSPYVYYKEHCILLAEEHRDMSIDQATFERLLTFVEKFPHYFIGSNADLPIVGGSILDHDHYQGGRYAFAMTRAETAFTFTLNGFDNISASVLKWPLSVIRLQSTTKDSLLHAAAHVLNTWNEYSDETVDVKAYTNETPHNTITPIARMRGGKFELDLVLRNNRTTEAHPLGIFHPHADVHHIKKENIGLIEVMGLAVLPARLKSELQEMKRFLLGEACNVEPYHADWANQLKEKYGKQSHEDEADLIIKKELGSKFCKVLEDAGVFKQNDVGRTAFQRFIKVLNETK